METIKGRFNENKDVLTVVDNTEIERAYEEIKNENTFILEYDFEGKKKSELVIAEGFLSRLKDGSLSIVSIQG